MYLSVGLADDAEIVILELFQRSFDVEVKNDKADEKFEAFSLSWGLSKKE